MTLFGYYADMLAERKRQPTDDLTRALLAAEVDGDRMTDQEIIAFLFLMVVAGNETTTKLLGNALYHLTAHPDAARRGCSPTRASSSSRWIEETLRYDTSTPAAGAAPRRRRRRCTASPRPPGSKLLLALGVGQPRRRGCSPTPTTLRHRTATRPSSRQIAQLRRRPALLPRRQPRPARGAGRAATSWYAGSARIEVDHDRRGAVLLGQRPRVRSSCRCTVEAR